MFIFTTNVERFFPLDTGRKLNVHKTSSERDMYVQFTSCVYWINFSYVTYQKSFLDTIICLATDLTTLEHRISGGFGIIGGGAGNFSKN